MSHLPILPILLPAFAGVLLIFLLRAGLPLQRLISLAATAVLAVISAILLQQADTGAYQVYQLGDWPAPFGIVLVVDRLSAYMLLLTSLVALGALSFAVQGYDARGKNFHPLFQLQLMGLAIAFLTGDIFNLFVAFEVLLIASYGLLLHGGGAARTRAGIHYVVINLTGSSLFLIAVGLIYAVTGTLNMADLAAKAALVPEADAPLLASGGLILLVVFAIKGALLPLYFWLPSAYAATTPPVAALFAIMTKVGVYAIIRVYTLIFGAEAGAVAQLAEPYLLPAALATLAVGMIGAVAARTLRLLVAYLVVASIGTLLVAVGLFSVEGLSAAIYYTAHSTLVTAGLFLLAGLVIPQRGESLDHLVPGQAVAQPGLLGVLFFGLAIAMAGVPPLSGFLGKLLVMNSALGHPSLSWIWAIILITSLMAMIGLSRAGTVLFWKGKERAPEAAGPASWVAAAPAGGMLALLVLMTLFAGPLTRLTDATATQLLNTRGYVEAVMTTPAALAAPELLENPEKIK